MKINIIVAVCNDNGIGYNGKIPWYIKEDLKHFSNTTKGNGNNAIVMGRKTWDSIGCKPLKNRMNIILSNSLVNDKMYSKDGAHFFNNEYEIIQYCINNNLDETWIIGGEKIYDLFLKNFYVSQCIITRLKESYVCDTFFPVLNNNWCLTETNEINENNNFVIEKWDQNIDNLDNNFCDETRYEYCSECCESVDCWNDNVYIFTKEKSEDKILCLDCFDEQKNELSELGWYCDDCDDCDDYK